MINLLVCLDGFVAHVCLDVLVCLDDFYDEDSLLVDPMFDFAAKRTVHFGMQHWTQW